MKINSELLREIYALEKGKKEEGSELKKEELISVQKILTYFQEREKQKNRECREYLESIKHYMPYLNYVSLSNYNQNEDEVKMVLNLQNTPLNKNRGFCKRNIILKNIDGDTTSDYYHYLAEDALLCLIKEQQSFRALATYAKENDFTKMMAINTISNLFRVSLEGNNFSIGNAVNLFRFYYGINSEDEVSLKTNIWGVSSILRDGTSFRENLQVYESDLPAFVKEGISLERKK